MRHSHTSPPCWRPLLSATLLTACAPHAAAAEALPPPAPPEAVFAQSADTVDAYDLVEISVTVTGDEVRNPFMEAVVRGSFGKSGDPARISVEGFADRPDGGLYKIRFMPAAAGEYTYRVTFEHGPLKKTHEGTFRARDARRRGPVRVDPAHPWHFIWEGTGEHYFFNGTTAYWILGWRDEEIIRRSIERLHRLQVNRMRVLLAGAANIYWGEAVMTGENFSMMLRPWVAEAPESFDRPGIDFTRFNVAHWQKFERMLRIARENDMIISVVLDISTHSAHAAAGSEEERRYFRYAINRLGAFSNLNWDLGDDLDSFRDEVWAHEAGTFIHSTDPYRHLATSHPVRREHQDRASEWFGFTSIQDWSRAQHALMLEERGIQQKTGRIIPQTNEEYGYEDHYPRWAPEPPGDSADTLRRVAWDIAMAGAYGTGAESCRRGTNIWPDTGGGWINGRGDDTMVLFKLYGHLVDFLTGIEWWKAEPHDDLVTAGAYCLAEPGKVYAVYLPKGKATTVKLEPGRYRASWFDPRTGERRPAGEAEGAEWGSPEPPGPDDWALLLQRNP